MTGSKLSFEQELYGLHLRQPHGSQTLRVRISSDVLQQMEAVKWLVKALCATIEKNHNFLSVVQTPQAMPEDLRETSEANISN